MSSTCLRNMVNLRPTSGWDQSGSLRHPCKSQRVSRPWQRYCTASSSGRQPNFAALNRERHLCSTGRPSRWALAHILVFIYCVKYWLTVTEIQDVVLYIGTRLSTPPMWIGACQHGPLTQVSNYTCIDGYCLLSLSVVFLCILRSV